MTRPSLIPPLLLLLIPLWACGGGTPPGTLEPTGDSGQEEPNSEGGLKPYSEVIPASAETDDGLFKVHTVGDDLFFEIPFPLHLPVGVATG